MTYNVFSGTLSLPQSINQIGYIYCSFFSYISSMIYDFLVSAACKGKLLCARDTRHKSCDR